MTRADDLEIRALVSQAWELRGTPYLIDAAAWIVDWHERRYLRVLERRQERRARLLRALRETDPARVLGRAA